MRKLQTVAILATAFVAGVLLAQGDGEYQSWMKMVAASNGSLQKNLQAKNASGVESDAKSLESTFKQVESFWEKKGASDAVNFAKQAQTAAAAIAKDAASNNMDQAGSDAKMLAATCGGCHMAHRQKGENGFTIK